MKSKDIVVGTTYAIGNNHSAHKGVVLQVNSEITSEAHFGRLTGFRRAKDGEHLAPRVLVLLEIDEDFDLTTVTVEDVLALRDGRSGSYAVHLARAATVLRPWSEHQAFLAVQRQEQRARQALRGERDARERAQAETVATRLRTLGIDARAQITQSGPTVVLTLAQIEKLLDRAES